MTISPTPGSTARNQYGTFAVHAPSEAQLKFVARLAATKDVTGLEGDIESYRAGRMNKKAASRFIDALLARPDATSAPAAIKRPASEKQVALIGRLTQERMWAPADGNAAVPPFVWIDAVLLGEQVESWQASKAIDHLFASPRAQRSEPAAELESGMYRVGDTVYKVYRAVHGSGRMCAKELVVTRGTGETEAHFEYRGLATRFVTADARMTLEQAKEFGAIYGVCCQCGATLTNEASIEAGIGPVCAGKI